MPTITLTIGHASGLHARPAAQFVKMAASFPCAITVRNLAKDKPAVNAKSVLSVITQGVSQGHQVEVTAEGDRAEEALAALQELVAGNFGEAAGGAPA
jgi:phosphotransferase system HPr (HPr) family protein